MHAQRHHENDNQDDGYPFPFYNPFVIVHLFLFYERNKRMKEKFIKKEVANLMIHNLYLAEREALEPMLSRNIIKLQITDNHILSKAQSKSKSF